jgi:hypothetical protein
MYTNVVSDIDLDAGTARSTTMYTVAQQIPDSGEPFAMLVAGRSEDEWAVIDGD